MTAIIGGLGAAFLWAGATLASSRSSRMIGSRVVLGWVMIVGLIVGLPLGVISGVPTGVPADAPFLVLVAAARDTQVGLVRRLLSHARQHAAAWLARAA